MPAKTKATKSTTGARRRTTPKRAAKPKAAPAPPEPREPEVSLSLDRVRAEAQRWYARIVDEAKGLVDDVLRGRPWQPKTDLYATETEVVLRANLPGVDASAVEILATGESITIRGEVPDDAEAGAAGYVHRHRDFGGFERRLPLPVAVQANKVQARMQRGILEIRLPIVAGKPKRPTKVRVKAS